jgi:hypothetical protein
LDLIAVRNQLDMAPSGSMIILVPSNGTGKGVSEPWHQEKHILDDHFLEDWGRGFFS